MAQATRNPEVVTTPGVARLPPPRQVSLAEQPTSPAPTIEELLQRMQAGDRAAAAEFLMRYESRLRRRIRGKLAPEVRRLFDSLDIVSTLGRRLDRYIVAGQLKVSSTDECLGLLCKMADNALVDKARIFRQLESIEGEDSDLAHELASRLRSAERRSRTGVQVEIEDCMQALGSPLERRILSLWLTGESLTSIGECVQLSPSSTSRRWLVIKEELRIHLQRVAAKDLAPSNAEKTR